MPEMPHLFLAWVLRNDGRSREAKEVLSEGLLLNPLSNNGLLEMVYLDCALGEHEEALKIASIMNRALPESTLTLQATAHALYFNREFKKAVPYYDRIIPEHKDDVDIIRCAADCFAKARMPERAADLLQEFVRVTPSHVECDVFNFQIAVYRLVNPNSFQGDPSDLVRLVEQGVTRGYGSRFDRLLAVGAMVNQREFEIGEKLLRLVESEKLDPSFDTLNEALRASLRDKQPFRFFDSSRTKNRERAEIK